MLSKVAWKSLLNRKITVMLTVFSIAVSVFVLLGVEHIRQEAKSSFGKTVSGVDLIVGARTGQLNLLLYSVFRIGNATNNIGWQSYQAIAKQPQVAWTIPISLGDSHKGYRVMGTDKNYFTYFRYGDETQLGFYHGNSFKNIFEAVVGAEVAKKLGYQIGDKIILSHGVGEVSFAQHDQHPFTVVGILESTGTPVDQTVHVSLEGIEAIHKNWQPGVTNANQEMNLNELTPKTITAFMVGLKSKVATFRLQRQINNYRAEPLLAILPGVALAELWQMLGTVERLLLVIALLVLLSALVGMSTMLLASMRERLRELAVLRAIGAGPLFIFLLIELEAILITLMGIGFAVLIMWFGLIVSQDFLSQHYGLFISANIFTFNTIIYIVSVLGAAILLALIPALSAYRKSLHSGLIARN